MKKVILLALCLTSTLAFAQQKVLLVDKSGIVTGEVRSAISDYLKDHEILIQSTIDFSVPCDYKTATILPNSERDIIELRDCDDRLLAVRDVETDLRVATDLERSVLLSLVIRQLLTNWGSGSEVLVPLAKQSNEHYSRYFFAPSAHNLRKNEFYYNTLYFGVHDIQYGISDRFSIGLGTTIAMMPIYVTPKLSIPITDKQTLSFGTLFNAGTYVQNWYVNLAFVNYTFGGHESNFTLSGGWLNAGNVNEFDLEGVNNKPVVSVGAMQKTGPHLYFVTEHYWSPIDQSTNASLDIWDPQQMTYFYHDVTLHYNSNLVLGFLGARWVNKSQHTKAWQFGVAYVLNLPTGKSDFEPKHQNYKDMGYDIDDLSEIFSANFFVLPAVTYTYKFGYAAK